MADTDPKSNDRDREAKGTRLKHPDKKQSKKIEENDSDLSVDEDETDDEEEKKRANTAEP